MDLSAATWTDAADSDADVAVLPTGSTEQHGPHAPLGTDAITASAVADAGLERTDRTVVRAPTVPVGVAAEHRHFAGTLWVEPDTFRNYVREVVESLASHGWDRVVVVNGHGGNVAALEELCGALAREGVAYAVPFTWFDAADVPDMGHGGPAETSVVAHTDPDLVRSDRLDAAAAGAAPTWGEWVAGVNLAHDAREFTDSGVVGDPREASAERGEALLDAAADALAELLDAVATRDHPAADGEPADDAVPLPDSADDE